MRTSSATLSPRLSRNVRHARTGAKRCHAPMDPDKLFMDHNHKTGEFLAWVCQRCNNRYTDDSHDELGESLPRKRR